MTQAPDHDDDAGDAVVIADATLADADAIAAVHAASWRATYRGILPHTFLDGDLLGDRQRHWHARMTSPPGELLVLKAVQQGVLRGFSCTLLDVDHEWGTLLDNLHVAPETIVTINGG